jgi:hypothetical protein
MKIKTIKTKSRRPPKQRSVKSYLQVKQPRRTWVIFDPISQQFVGSRWHPTKYALQYSLGDFTGGYQLTSRKQARETLGAVQNFVRYSAMTKEEMARLKIYRVRYCMLTLQPMEK